jgi:hypothetical protein
LDRSLNDIYITDVCNTAEALPLMALGFIELFDYTTLMLASVVFIDNVLAGRVSAFGLQRYGHTHIADSLPYNYIE